MKLLYILVPSLFLTFNSSAEIWSMCDTCDTPESAYYDPVSNQIFISNVAGTPDGKDGKGWISLVAPSGKVKNAQWFKGLNAPKGMRSYKDTLFVADIDSVIGISISKGKEISRIVIQGAKMINDIVVDTDGVIYASDTFLSAIYRINGTKHSIFISGKEFESPNGLLLLDNTLIVAPWGYTTDWKTETPGHLYSVDLKTKKKTLITAKPLGNLDGIEQDADGSFLTSDWVAGTVYRVTKDGVVTTLLKDLKGAADIGLMSKTKTLIVPRMAENLISAYDLSKIK